MAIEWFRTGNSQTRFAYFILGLLGGKYFANPSFSARLLYKHLFIQKVLRINHHVPWPVHPTSVVSDVQHIDPGTRCPGLSPGCYIQGKNGILFGRNVWVGPGVAIISANHAPDDFYSHLPFTPIQIGNNCWIGANAVILPGVKLGEHVIVGAGAVVTHSQESDCVVAGNPARVTRQLGPYRGPMEKQLP